jgi:hypothetical protein
LICSQDPLRPEAAASRTPIFKSTSCSPRKSYRALVFTVLCLGVVQPTEAQALELTGAWASQADLCKLVFTKKGNQIVFAELSDIYGSGFIIDGSRIRGKTTQCTIKSKKQEGDSLELNAACASRIMTSSVRFNLKVVDDNTLNRLIPEIPGMEIKYARCSI